MRYILSNIEMLGMSENGCTLALFRINQFENQFAKWNIYIQGVI